MDHKTLELQLADLLRQQCPNAELKVVHTHISTIFLIGDKAYKLKKPLKLPFLDFSTLAQRAFYSAEELRLNQRQCPTLYKALHTVCGSVQEGIVLDSPSLPVLDYLLEMQRFDAAGEFAQMAKSGTLNSEHIQSLAKHTAQFHLGLKPVFDKNTSKRTADWARESFDEIEALEIFQAMPNERANELKCWREQLLGRFKALESMRNQRFKQGYVRECHGDLHLGNIVQWQGQVMGFDALEFDVNLRTIDVIQDVAFTFMDLYAYDLAPLAWDFINTYLEETGDYYAMPLLLVYAAYKALVRAKVALLGEDLKSFERYWKVLGSLMAHPSLNQSAAGEKTVERGASDAQDCNRPDDAYSSTVKLILMMGLSGSGKSVVARMVAQQIGALRLRSDTERKRLHREGKLIDAQGTALALYSKEASTLTNQRLDALTAHLIRHGLNVVLDTVSPYQVRREFIRQLALARQAKFYVIKVQAPETLLIQRLDERVREGKDISDATKEVMLEQRQLMQEIPPEWLRFTYTVNNDGNLAQLESRVQDLVQHLRTRET